MIGYALIWLSSGDESDTGAFLGAVLGCGALAAPSEVVRRAMDALGATWHGRQPTSDLDLGLDPLQVHYLLSLSPSRPRPCPS